MELKHLKRIAGACALAGVTFAAPGAAHAVMVLFDTPAEAAVRSIDAPNDYLSYTFTIDLAGGESLTEFDAIFMSATMNQVLPGVTPWNDLTESLGQPPPNSSADDSQFNFSVSDWNFPQNPQDSETPGLLRVGATRAGGMMGTPAPKPPLTSDFSLAHIVIPVMASGQWQISVRVNDVTHIFPSPGQFGVFGPAAIPEVSQVVAGAVISAGVLGVFVARRSFGKGTARA